jgi:hypothetical protein
MEYFSAGGSDFIIFIVSSVVFAVSDVAVLYFSIMIAIERLNKIQPGQEKNSIYKDSCLYYDHGSDSVNIIREDKRREVVSALPPHFKKLFVAMIVSCFSMMTAILFFIRIQQSAE